MMYGSVIVGITISRGSFVFSQSRVKVSPSLTDVGSLVVKAYAVVNCSLSVAWFVPIRLTLVSRCRNVVLGLWVTRML